MVFETFQRTAFFYDVGAHTQQHSSRARDDDSITTTTTSDKSQRPQPWPTTSRLSLSLLGPLAGVLKSSADVVNGAVLHIRDGLTDEERERRAQHEQQKQSLHNRLKSAELHADWKRTAEELDERCDKNAWKAEAESEDYDARLIAARLAQMDEARIGADVPQMIYLVRTALARDLGGMGNIRLYKRSYIGTKDLIERYIDSTVDTIRALVAVSETRLPPGIESKDILEQVVYARQAFGRSALLLSGGATFGMNHVGVLKALFEARLLPRIISGASAGSIVCAIVCTRTDEEIPQVLADFPFGDLAVFENAHREDGILERVGRLLTNGSWIDIKHLVRVMQLMLGDLTFQEAYNRTRRILNICVSSASIYELPRLLNYITSPNVMIWSAVAASCSVPLLFSAAPLLVKNPVTGEHVPWNPGPQQWIDGSVDNDLPMTRLAEMFNVNHFIVSQVNPHVVPFLAKDDANITAAANNKATSSNWPLTLSSLARDEALHRLQTMADLGICTNLVTKARAVLSQKYSGDITILPEINYHDFPKMLKNPTARFIVKACLRGEQATWPKLSRIRNHCAIELELDAAVQKLRARVVFSPSAIELRKIDANTNSLMDPTKSAAYLAQRRRVSGSGLQHGSPKDEEEKNADDKTYFKKAARPQLRKANSSNYVPTRSTANLPTISISPFSPDAATPAWSTKSKKSTPVTPVTPIRVARLGQLTLPEPISETDYTDTYVGFSTSDADADVDSHTDDSSPEPETQVPSSNDFNNNSYSNLSGSSIFPFTFQPTNLAGPHITRPDSRNAAPISPRTEYPPRRISLSLSSAANFAASQPLPCAHSPSFYPSMLPSAHGSNGSLSMSRSPNEFPLTLSMAHTHPHAHPRGRSRTSTITLPDESTAAVPSAAAAAPGGGGGDAGRRVSVVVAAPPVLSTSLDPLPQSRPEKLYKRLFHGTSHGLGA